MIICTGVPRLFPRGRHGGPAGRLGKSVSPGRSGWGGWDSNPGPADYESSTPAACLIYCDLGGHKLARSWMRRFRHVFGMIMLGAG